jgi:hypothetical protein
MLTLAMLAGAVLLVKVSAIVGGKIADSIMGGN